MLERALSAPDLGLPVPEWYAVDVVARRWSTTPMAVMEAPAVWFHRALAAQAAENFAQRQASEQR